MIALAAILVLVLAVGTVYLVRIGTAATSNAGGPSSPSATPRAGTSGSTAAGSRSGDPDVPGGSAVRGVPGGPGLPAVPGGPSAPGTPSGVPRPSVRLRDSSTLYVPVFSGDGVKVAAGEIQNMSIFQVPSSFQVPVELVGVSLRNDQPGDPILLTTPKPFPLHVECRPGVTATPTPEVKHLCDLGLTFSDSAALGRYDGTIILEFTATCTFRSGYPPCGDLPEKYAPSPDNPIDVKWSNVFGFSLIKVPAATPADEGTSGSPTPP
jgi:hypothetical protein